MNIIVLRELEKTVSYGGRLDFYATCPDCAAQVGCNAYLNAPAPRATGEDEKSLLDKVRAAKLVCIEALAKHTKDVCIFRNTQVGSSHTD
jgi:hypothetical protein